jgi:hypothetical protein
LFLGAMVFRRVRRMGVTITQVPMVVVPMGVRVRMRVPVQTVVPMTMVFGLRRNHDT